MTAIPGDGIVVDRHWAAYVARLCPTQIQGLLGEEYFYFYDAAAPIVEKDSIDMDEGVLGFPLRQGRSGIFELPDDRRRVRTRSTRR